MITESVYWIRPVCHRHKTLQSFNIEDQIKEQGSQKHILPFLSLSRRCILFQNIQTLRALYGHPILGPLDEEVEENVCGKRRQIGLIQ